jgi:hypothetical protein
MSEEPVLISVADGIATLTLNRPDAGTRLISRLHMGFFRPPCAVIRIPKYAASS